MFSKEERTGCLLIVYVVFSLVVWRILSDIDKNYDLEKTLPAHCHLILCPCPGPLDIVGEGASGVVTIYMLPDFLPELHLETDSPSPCSKEENYVMRAILKKNCTFYLISLFSAYRGQKVLLKVTSENSLICHWEGKTDGPTDVFGVVSYICFITRASFRVQIDPVSRNGFARPRCWEDGGHFSGGLKAREPRRATLQWDYEGWKVEEALGRRCDPWSEGCCRNIWQEKRVLAAAWNGPWRLHSR